MKREVKSEKEKQVRLTDPPKSMEREFGNSIEYMVDQMAKRFRNQVFKELNKGTIEKFEDAQTGNFANIYLALARKARRKMVRQFSTKRIERMSNKYTGQVDKRNKEQLYERVEKSIGISAKELEATEGLTSQINAYKLETSQWVEKMRDETMQMWTANTLRLMAEGQTLDQILSQFDDMVEKRKGHAKMIARTQITTFNSLVTKARAQNLGIEKAIWVTARDERVRPCHRVRDGKEFDLSEGLYSSCDGKTLLPGNDYNCRCIYKLVIPEE